jgi:hypothetical protein
LYRFGTRPVLAKKVRLSRSKLRADRRGMIFLLAGRNVLAAAAL